MNGRNNLSYIGGIIRLKQNVDMPAQLLELCYPFFVFLDTAWLFSSETWSGRNDGAEGQYRRHPAGVAWEVGVQHRVHVEIFMLGMFLFKLGRVGSEEENA